MGKGAHNIFQDLGAKVLAIVIGKPEQRHTDETPVVQPVNSLPSRIIHQDEARGDKGVVWRAYLAQQPALHPRIVKPEGAEKTGPKRVSHLGYIQEVVPQYVQPGQRTTGGMKQISGPQTPIPETRAQEHKEAERVQVLSAASLPPWLRDLRDNALPIERQQPVEDVPQVPFIDDKPGELMTLRRDSLPLPAGFSQPFSVEDLAPNGQQADAWLNAPAPVLAPLPDEALAASDRWTVLPWVAEPSSGLGPMPHAWDELETLAAGQANDDTLEVPAVMKKQHEKKESE